MITINLIRPALFVASLLVIISCNQTELRPGKQAFQKTEVEVLSLLTTPDPEKFSLTLGAKTDTTFTLTMIVGNYEAQQLAITLQDLKPKSPSPLDLLKDAIKKFEYTVKEVIIDSLKNDYYTAKIICNKGDKILELKARPVDAVTIAAKFNAAIFVNNTFLRR